MPRRRPLRARPTPPGQGLEPAVSPGHGPEAAWSRIARRGVLFGAPAALLAGCGMLGAGEEQAPTAGQGPAGEAGADGADEVDDGPEAELSADDPSGTGTVALGGVVIEDVMDVGALVEPLDDSPPLLHPLAAVTVTGMALLHELTPERFT